MDSLEVSNLSAHDEVSSSRAPRERVSSRETERALWFDSSALNVADSDLLSRLPNTQYSGIVWRIKDLEVASGARYSRLDRVIQIESAGDLDVLSEKSGGLRWIVACDNPDLLDEAMRRGNRTCLRALIEDAEGLEAAIRIGQRHAFLLLRFRDPTNIPLELVIASLQVTETVLIKEIAPNGDVDGAVVALGVMEVGADGVLFSPREHAVLDAFLARLRAEFSANIPISVGRIVRTAPIGMGQRSCLDLTTLFAESEGMLVGSTSQGGLLCCPEVFYLPYMELRPFRVNAGAVHSYVFNAENRTNYMTELQAGSGVVIVERQGHTRVASVGRVKTEVRPLRLIEVEFAAGERVNVIMQDDWHVRIFSDVGTPLNITELRPGDAVLGHVAVPGRHVGIQVVEQIIER